MNSRYRRMHSSSPSYISHQMEIPLGVMGVQHMVQQCCPRSRYNRRNVFKISIFMLTYLAYTCYHMSRKPISVVKSVLQCNSTNNASSSLEATVTNYNHSVVVQGLEMMVSSTLSKPPPHCGYAPFDDNNAPTLFALLDSAFLFAYAGAMFVSGFVAERVSLRYFLASGMIVSGIFSYLFGMAKIWSIHSIGYFVLVQAGAGIAQTTGWPGVVALIGRWFGKSKRGLIFGIWNSHTSIGNILGTWIAAKYVEINWAYSFIVPGILIALCGLVVFLFVVDSPDLIGYSPPVNSRPSSLSSTSSSLLESNDVEENDNHSSSLNESSPAAGPTERTPILESGANVDTVSGAIRSNSATMMSHQRPIKLLDALRIPGVLEFSLCLFFSKLVSYTFLYWLPLYIQSSSTLGPTLSADLSILFDVGGIFGAIVAGMVSDWTGMSATICTVMLFLASPVLLVYPHLGSSSLSLSVFLLLLAGFLVNGPYALITTTVSAELGQHSSLEDNALATVTAIIDGTGSIGAAMGPLMAGVISKGGGWQNVFNMLIISDILAMLLLVRQVKKEYHLFRRFARIRIE